MTLPTTQRELTAHLKKLQAHCIETGLKYEVAILTARRSYLRQLERASAQKEREDGRED